MDGRYAPYRDGRRRAWRSKVAGFVLGALIFGAVLPAIAVMIKGYTTTNKIKTVAITDDGKLSVNIGDAAVPVLASAYPYGCTVITSTGSTQVTAAHSGRLASLYANAGTMTIYRGSDSSVAAGHGFPMGPGDTFSPDNPISYRGPLWFRAASSSGTVCWEDYR